MNPLSPRCTEPGGLNQDGPSWLLSCPQPSTQHCPWPRHGSQHPSAQLQISARTWMSMRSTGTCAALCLRATSMYANNDYLIPRAIILQGVLCSVSIRQQCWRAKGIRQRAIKRTCKPCPKCNRCLRLAAYTTVRCGVQQVFCVGCLKGSQHLSDILFFRLLPVEHPFAFSLMSCKLGGSWPFVLSISTTWSSQPQTENWLL